jgi:SAM-dependent methyltransferase
MLFWGPRAAVFRSTGKTRSSKEDRGMATQSRTPDLTALKERQVKAWSPGDYGKIGVRILLIGELLCEAVDVHPGQKVLDVACGNASLAAARRFCEVTGVDYVPELLQEGRERCSRKYRGDDPSLHSCVMSSSPRDGA